MISRRSAMGVRKALQQYRPEFAVYYAARNGATYQLGMWLPYFERVNRRFIVITCHPSTVPEITKLTSAPVVVPKPSSAHGRLWHLVVDSLKAAFYVQNHADNVDMLRFSKLTHIWLNHGDSDKAANFSARHAAFDKIFVSGQLGVDRYAAHGVKIRPEQFAIVGRPQIERIETRDMPLPAEAPRTVLYAPTWQGGKPTTNYSSLPLGPRIVDALLARGVTVIFRPHPHTYRDPQQTGIAQDIQHRLSADRKSSWSRARLRPCCRGRLGHSRLLQPLRCADQRRVVGRVGLPGNRQADGYGRDSAKGRRVSPVDSDGPGCLRHRTRLEHAACGPGRAARSGFPRCGASASTAPIASGMLSEPMHPRVSSGKSREFSTAPHRENRPQIQPVSRSRGPGNADLSAFMVAIAATGADKSVVGSA